MKQGTKSLLFGCHQFLWHPFFVALGWILYHNRFPKLWELVCIFVHDWGIWGKDYLDNPEAKLNHPELGAILANELFGMKAYGLVTGHSKEFINYWNRRMGHNRELSDLFYADKYSHLLLPNFILSWQHWAEGMKIEGNNQVVREMAISCLYKKKDMHTEFIERQSNKGA